MASARILLLILGSAVFLSVVNACTRLQTGNVPYGAKGKTYYYTLDASQKSGNIYVGPENDYGSVLLALDVEVCLVGRPALVKIALQGNTLHIERMYSYLSDALYFQVTAYYAPAGIVSGVKTLKSSLLGYADGERAYQSSSMS